MTARAQIQTYAASLLRIVAGAMFAFHGVQKIFGFLMPEQPAVGSQLWIGGMIELVCGTMVAIGLFTRPAALLASGTMAVAYFQFHWKLDFSHWRFFPAINAGEPAVLYCFVFLMFAAAGAGPLSLDQRRGR